MTMAAWNLRKKSRIKYLLLFGVSLITLFAFVDSATASFEWSSENINLHLPLTPHRTSSLLTPDDTISLSSGSSVSAIHSRPTRKRGLFLVKVLSRIFRSINVTVVSTFFFLFSLSLHLSVLPLTHISRTTTSMMLLRL